MYIINNDSLFMILSLLTLSPSKVFGDLKKATKQIHPHIYIGDTV